MSKGTTAEVTRGAGFRACQAAWKGCSTCVFCPNASKGIGAKTILLRSRRIARCVALLRLDRQIQPEQGVTLASSGG